MSSLPARLFSALIAVIALFAVRGFWQADGLFAMTLFFTSIGLWEFTRFFPEPVRSDSFFRWLFILLGTVTFSSSYFSITALLYSFWLSSTVATIYLILKVRNEHERVSIFQSMSLTTIGLFYCSLSTALTCQVLKFANGPEWFLTILAIVFFGDSFAFFAGYLFGKKKLHPLVSPKKTWAGSIGGLLGSMAFGFLFTRWFGINISTAEILAISFVAGVFGQLGDLFESLLKRAVGVKDSGGIMPGHGGILDRIDGVIFAGPVFYVLAQYAQGHI